MKSLARPWPEASPSLLAPVAEHADLRAVVRQILDDHASHEKVRVSAESPLGYAPELWKLLNQEMSLSALAVPEARGGLGYGLRELGVVLEECGRALVCEPVLASAVLGVQSLLRAPEGVAEELLQPAVRGDVVVTMAPLEPGHVDAVAVGGDGWAVHGRLPRVLQGGAADAVMLLAGTEAGPALFAVDLRDAPVRREELTTIDLRRRQAALIFEGASAALLVPPERAHEATAVLHDLARASLACEHVGVVDRMLSMTLDHVSQRHQFGRPLGSFQVIKHRLADMLVDLERSRSAARYAASVWTDDPKGASLAADVAAAVCTEATLRATADAVQLHGGIAFTWEHEAHYYVRRALGDEPLFGDARGARARIAEQVGV
ncbi:acyl-CoA dehydrogenase family protein [Allosalinactinospora lopnorensis]|uniref:acyl-CoA dehydrogenase family protein n=1 Tax=Allosalinactinospora lopnorensis TaxID=1352348 RepID=UPI000623E25E|nr:acyl-CoA dehydrogenase family protein [Allosalinactinospora lopnorensis]